MFIYLTVVVLAVAGAVQCRVNLPAELQEMMRHLANVCETETGVDRGIIEAARKFELKDDPKLKCFFKCMMVNMQVLNDDGNLDHDVIEQTMAEELKKVGALEVVEMRKGTKGTDNCDTAFQLIKCFLKNGKDLAELFL